MQTRFLLLGCITFTLSAAVVGGCGGEDQSKKALKLPAKGSKSGNQAAAVELGFPLTATKNTTRVGGGDPTTDAAAVASAIYPGGIGSQRPNALIVAPSESWQSALAASQLVGSPVNAPILLGSRESIPEVTKAAIGRLQPKGIDKAAKTKLISIDGAQTPAGIKTRKFTAQTPADLALKIDRFRVSTTGQRSNRVIVVSSEHADFALPAAGWAAKSGDAILFVDSNGIPAATKKALQARERPRIYVIGPGSVVSRSIAKKLRRFGSVTRVSAGNPIDNAIEFSKFVDGDFGWGITDPGHGLVFYSRRRPLDAIAASALSAAGSYGPLLPIEEPNRLPTSLRNYLLDIQPGYESDPVRGVYNRGWLIGDSEAISLSSQQQIDAILEIVPVKVR